MDIVLSFDTTGSMRPCIREVRRKAVELVNTLFDEYNGLRIGIISHDDYCDYPRIYNELLLTSNRKEIVDFINTTPDTSGGDSDECYELILDRVSAFNWREDVAKVFVLLGDADPHEVGYRYNNFKVTVDWRERATYIKDRGIVLYPVQCLYGSSRFYNQLAQISGTPKLSLAQFSDINQLISAVVHKASSNERLEEYSTQLEDEGKLNRNLASIIDRLLGKRVVETEEGILTPKYPYTRTVTSRYFIPEGLIPVKEGRFQLLHVDVPTDIKTFVENTGARFKKGMGFYELTKAEDVQETKEVILRDKISGDMFTGKDARNLIGIPYGTRGRVKMRDGKYDIFIQSTSNNRKLVDGTRFLYEAEMY